MAEYVAFRGRSDRKIGLETPTGGNSRAAAHSITGSDFCTKIARPRSHPQPHPLFRIVPEYV